MSAVRAAQFRAYAEGGRAQAVLGPRPDQVRVAVGEYRMGDASSSGLRPFPRAGRHRREGPAGRAGVDVGDLVVPDHLQGDRAAHPAGTQPPVPELLLERDLARAGAERTQHPRRAGAVRASHGAFAACPGASREVRCGQARGGGQRDRVPDAHHQEGARRGDDIAGERPDHAGHHRRDRPVRRPVRHGVGRLSRAGRHRHVGLGHARQGGRSGRRGADHDRHRPRRRPAGRDGLQLADPLQPRADGQARRLRLRAADLPVDGPRAAGRPQAGACRSRP